MKEVFIVARLFRKNDPPFFEGKKYFVEQLEIDEYSSYEEAFEAIKNHPEKSTYQILKVFRN